jgi:hypothetical protein
MAGLDPAIHVTLKNLGFLPLDGVPGRDPGIKPGHDN